MKKWRRLKSIKLHIFHTSGLNKDEESVNSAAKNILYIQGSIFCELKEISFSLKKHTLVIKQVQGQYTGKGKGKAISEGPEGSRSLRFPDFMKIWPMKVAKLSAPHTGRLYPTRDITGTHLCWRLSRLQGRSAVGRIKSEKNANDPMVDRTRDLSTCSVLPQPTALLRVTLRH